MTGSERKAPRARASRRAAGFLRWLGLDRPPAGDLGALDDHLLRDIGLSRGEATDLSRQ